MPTKESKADFDVLVSKYSDEVRALATRTRKLVLEIMPNASEKTYWGWSNTWYGTSEKNVDAIFAISPQKAHVNLFLLRGTEMTDPDGLLEGTGKKLRHVKIREAADVKRASLRKLLKRALVQARKAK